MALLDRPGPAHPYAPDPVRLRLTFAHAGDDHYPRAGDQPRVRRRLLLPQPTSLL